jgi:hypothetical protein
MSISDPRLSGPAVDDGLVGRCRWARNRTSRRWTFVRARALERLCSRGGR